MSTSKNSQSTIMFTDIVGYSAMINKDENHALQLLETHDKIIEPIIAHYKGNIIKKIGDAIFAEFPDARSGMNTAIEIQSTLVSRNAISEKNDLIRIRIGLHTGDVIRKDNDLFGHDINICSRIESIAPKGGIAASTELINAVNVNHRKYIREMGYVKLKNITHPHQIYKIYINADDYESESEKQLQKNLRDNGINVVDMDSYSIEESYSVGILYINNIGNEQDESLAYSLTDELISDFEYIDTIRTANFNDIINYKETDLLPADIGRKLEVENILRGSILKKDDELQLSFELLDINKGQILWNEKWTSPIINNKKIRQHIIQSISENFDIDLPQTLQNLYSEEITLNTDALEIYYKGKYCADHLKSNEEIQNAKKHLNSAIELDPNFVEAYSELSLVCQHLGQSEVAESNLNTAQNIAEKKKDEQGLASIYNIKGAINVAIGKYKNARINYEKALEIQMNLNNKIKESKFRSNYANCLNQLQEVDLALEQSEKAIQIKEALEQHQSLGASYAILSNTYYGSGKYTEAIEHAVKALGVFRMNEMTLFEGRILTLIADLYMLIGQYDNMSKYIKEADVILKDFNESFLLGKIERMKAIYALYNNNSDDAIENINNAIDLFEIAEMRPYIIEAHIDKLNILVERKEYTKANKIISKVELLLNKLDNPPNRPIINVIKILINENTEQDIESIEDQIGKGAIIDMKFSYWYISQIYASHNKMDKAKIYQQKSIDIIDEIAKQITSSNDKNSFINAEYYHNKIKQDISTIEEIKKDDDTTSIFAFCPSCGFKNENLFAFCPSCGNDLKQ